MTATLRRDPRHRWTSAGERVEARQPRLLDSPAVRVEDIQEVPLVQGCVVALLDDGNGKLPASDRAVLAAAREWADWHQLTVTAVVFGAVNTDIRQAGADAFVSFDQETAIEDRASAVSTVLAECRSELLFASCDGEGADTARRIAAARDWKLLSRVVQQEPNRLRCRTGDPTLETENAPVPVRLVDAAYGRPARAFGGPLRKARAPAYPAAGVLREVGMIAADPATVPISDSEFVIAAGAGVSDWDLFFRAARALGAATAGSRVVVDAGHLPRERQVGASGTAVRARCYLALGISGAIQHLEGIAGCARVISVNPDDACGMTSRADVSFINDAHEVMRALIEELGQP